MTFIIFCSGGGRRCEVEECNKLSQSGGRCTRHGGGSRCFVEGCERGAIKASKLCMNQYVEFIAYKIIM